MFLSKLLQVCVCVWPTAPGVCVCVWPTAPGVCVCGPLLQVCVCVCVCGPLLQVCACVCVWPTAPSVHVCARVCACVCVHLDGSNTENTHFTAGYTLYKYVCDKKKIFKNDLFFFFTKPIMVKSLNIGKNIGKPIHRSISKDY